MHGFCEAWHGITVRCQLIEIEILNIIALPMLSLISLLSSFHFPTLENCFGIANV